MTWGQFIRLEMEWECGLFSKNVGIFIAKMFFWKIKYHIHALAFPGQLVLVLNVLFRNFYKSLRDGKWGLLEEGRMEKEAAAGPEQVLTEGWMDVG